MTAIDLGTYDGRPITKSSITIPNAGGGLHEALGLDPVLLHTGEEVDVLLRCTVGKHTHDPIMEKGEDTGEWNLVFTLHADRGTILSDTSVGDKVFTKLSTRLAKARKEQESRAAAAAAEAAGQDELGLGSGPPAPEWED